MHRTSTSSTSPKSNGQTIFIIRHGDRWDYSHPEWYNAASPDRRGDPPLSDLGHVQAREAGTFLDTLLSREDRSAQDITLLCSPFLRCIETANNILQKFSLTQGDVANTVQIKLEHSVWEIDGHEGVNHRYLIENREMVKERSWYFPRIDPSYVPLFVPELPETKVESLARFERVIEAIHAAYPFKENQVLVIVTHAAACIGLVKAATGKAFQEITPAGPCSIFRLDRGSAGQTLWDIDDYATPGGMNGYVSHVTEAGRHTIPWNNYGPKSKESGGSIYTGPPRSEIETFFQVQPAYRE